MKSYTKVLPTDMQVEVRETVMDGCQTLVAAGRLYHPRHKRTPGKKNSRKRAWTELKPQSGATALGRQPVVGGIFRSGPKDTRISRTIECDKLCLLRLCCEIVCHAASVTLTKGDYPGEPHLITQAFKSRRSSC